MDASHEIGCSHVLAYKALNNEIASAYGWRLEYISKDDPQCANFKKDVEARGQAQRQAIVKFAREEMLKRKRKEIVKEAKAQRKAEHDEIVSTLRGWLVAMA